MFFEPIFWETARFRTLRKLAPQQRRSTSNGLPQPVESALRHEKNCPSQGPTISRPRTCPQNSNLTAIWPLRGWFASRVTPAEIGISQKRIGCPEAHRVGEIEELGSQFQFHPFPHRKILEEPHINIPFPSRVGGKTRSVPGHLVARSR